MPASAIKWDEVSGIKGTDTCNQQTISDQPLLACLVKVHAVIDSNLFRGYVSEHLWLPGVQVAVEVDDGDLAVGAIDRLEKQEDDGVVTTKHDDMQVVLAVSRDRHEGLVGQQIVSKWQEGGTM